MTVSSGLEDVRGDLVDSSFEQAVTLARKNRSTELLSNRSASHARHVMLELFELAIEHKSKVSIVSGQLNKACYGEQLINKLESAVAAGIEIEVIALDLNAEQLKSNDFGRRIVASAGCSAYVLADGARYSDAPHFCVVHGLGFRFETDKDSAQAVLSFNQPPIAKTLEDTFQTLKAVSKRVNNV